MTDATKTMNYVELKVARLARLHLIVQEARENIQRMMKVVRDSREIEFNLDTHENVDLAIGALAIAGRRVLEDHGRATEVMIAAKAVADAAEEAMWQAKEAAADAAEEAAANESTKEDG